MEIPGNLLSVDCLIQHFVSNANSRFRMNYLRIITYALLPFSIIYHSWVFWLIYGCFMKMSKKERQDRTNGTISIILFLFYPTIVF